MALETKLLQKLSQSLLMTPQLQQAIKLLQLGRLEYKEAIEKELLENPILEEIRDHDDERAPIKFDESSTDPLSPTILPGEQSSDSSENLAETTSSRQETKIDWEDYLESFTDSQGSATARGTFDHDDRPSYEGSLTRSESLVEHLIAQLRMIDLDKDDSIIALHLIGNIDRDGYLCSTYEEIAEACSADLDNVSRVAQIIRCLDPVGIASRNLSECLITQLEYAGLENSLEVRIVRDHLDSLEKRKYDVIAKVENVDMSRIKKALTTIQGLEPRPGRPFADDAIRYVVPDVYVYKVGNEYVISSNEDGLPKLRVSPYYLRLLKNGESENVPNKSYLTDRLKAATWLIRSIHQRQQTIYKVVESIVKFQREFLDYGIGKLKPLVLKDVADDIGMHESTVSRVTTNKYVHTPQGVFELKYFFTTGIKTATGDVSSSAVKERIKNLIAGETAHEPISDQRIVELLKQEHIDIARRTVAKYRESLGIESSSRRKKIL